MNPGDISPLTVWLTGLILALVLFVIVFPAICTACYHFMSYKSYGSRYCCGNFFYNDDGLYDDDCDDDEVDGAEGFDDYDDAAMDHGQGLVQEDEYDEDSMMEQGRHARPSRFNRWHYCHPVMLTNSDGVKVIGNNSAEMMSNSQQLNRIT